MPTQTADLFLLEDLEDVGRTSALTAGDLDALRAVGNWIETFVARPHEDLGRSGTVCPFVPVALERKTLWLAPERIADQNASDVAELVYRYQRLFLDIDPAQGDDAVYKSFVIVFTDLPADRAGAFFGEVLGQIAVPSYENDGFEMGGFYEGNTGTAVYNASFRPFQSPVPFLLVRQAVVSDWKFFLEKEDWLRLWARRYGESAVQALADELRRLPWREASHSDQGGSS